MNKSTPTMTSPGLRSQREKYMFAVSYAAEQATQALRKAEEDDAAFTEEQKRKAVFAKFDEVFVEVRCCVGVEWRCHGG
jgi:hypothetical protein